MAVARNLPRLREDRHILPQLSAGPDNVAGGGVRRSPGADAVHIRSRGHEERHRRLGIVPLFLRNRTRRSAHVQDLPRIGMDGRAHVLPRFCLQRYGDGALTSSDVEGGRDYAMDMFYATKAGWRGETTRGKWDTYVFCTNFVVHHSQKINI